MEKLKFTLFSIVILALVGILGYWAIVTIESGGTHANLQKELALKAENVRLEEEINILKNKIASLEAAKAEQELAQTPQTPTETPAKPTATTSTSSKNKTLVNELQKLIDDKVFMKQGSRGTRVGTVQKFLNIYNKTNKTIDNDYGPGLKADVMKFQKDQGLSADGEAGPTTFAKMIEWLKKQ